jgi:Cu2+-exporting ATPase
MFVVHVAMAGHLGETALAASALASNLKLIGISFLRTYGGKGPNQHCGLIEKLFDRQPGALAIHVDPALGRLQWRVDADRFDPVAFARELQNYGYLLGPLNHEAKPARNTLVIRLGVCAALAMNAMLFTLPSYLGMAPGSDLFALFRNGAFVCGTLSFLVGGSYFLGRSLQSLRARVLHIDLPISLGPIAAYAGSLVAWRAGADGFVYFDFVSMFTFLMLVGRWVQQAAVEKNRRRLLGAPLNPLQPPIRRPVPDRVRPGHPRPLQAAFAGGPPWAWNGSTANPKRARPWKAV